MKVAEGRREIVRKKGRGGGGRDEMRGEGGEYRGREEG